MLTAPFESSARRVKRGQAVDCGSCGDNCRRQRDTCYCVFTLALDGSGVEMNCVASSTPSPSGVGTENRNGTKTRVPVIGTSHTSMSFSSVMYLIAARSGTWPATGEK